MMCAFVRGNRVSNRYTSTSMDPRKKEGDKDTLKKISPLQILQTFAGLEYQCNWYAHTVYFQINPTLFPKSLQNFKIFYVVEFSTE